MNQKIKGSIAAIILLGTAPVIGDPMNIKDIRASAMHDESLFDAARGAILEGAAGREMAEMWGANDSSKEWKISPSDIKSLEKELAPLLADDLTRVGSSASPNRYYRQYTAGTFANRDAISVNGFHQSYLSTFNDASWLSRAVGVLDGGDNYWCAIYVKSLRSHFVKYKNGPDDAGEMHVSFHGEA